MPGAQSSPPEVLWSPPTDVRATTRIGDYLEWLERRYGRRFDDYESLWAWDHMFLGSGRPFPFLDSLTTLALLTAHTERVDRILPREIHDDLVAKTPLGRLGQPEETAMATLFLASDAASGYLTGVTIDISGGRVML